METIVNTFVLIFLVYLAIGFLTAIIIQPKGLAKIDPTVEGAGFWFRFLTFPGIILLWPVMISKWIKSLKSNKAKS